MAKAFLAGPTGAIRKRVVPQLLESGYEVFGAAELKTAGVTPIVVDVFDALALSSNDCGLPGNRQQECPIDVARSRGSGAHPTQGDRK